MKRALVVSLVLAVIFVAWVLASGRADTAIAALFDRAPSAASPPAAKQKPICSQAIVPAGADCIPQHMANLPPDPGEAGKATIDGVISTDTGVRDDVLRFIHENWPDSERARQVLYLVAKSKQLQVHHGGDLSKEETRKFVPEIMRKVTCFSRVETEEMIQQNAMQAVQNKVLNTPERWARAADFGYQLAHATYELPDASNIVATCGFDPAALPN